MNDQMFSSDFYTEEKHINIAMMYLSTINIKLIYNIVFLKISLNIKYCEW